MEATLSTSLAALPPRLAQRPPAFGSPTRASILRTIRRHPEISRIELATLLNIDFSTVSLAVKKMMSEGILCERGAMKRDTGRGRPRIRLGICDDVAVCAVEVTGNAVSVAIVDLSGRILTLERTFVPPTLENLAVFVNRVVDQFQGAARRAFRIDGIGVTVSDHLLVRPSDGAFVADAFEDKIKRKFQLRIPVAVEVESEMSAMLLGEAVFGSLSDVESAALVHVGESVRAVTMSQGQLHSGHATLPGQFGHLTVEPEGERCTCGQRGCLDTLASSRAVLERYCAAGGEDRSGESIVDFLNRAESGDPEAQSILAQQMDALACGLRALTLMMSPQAIMLTGPVADFWSETGPLLDAALQDRLGRAKKPELRRNGNLEQMRLLGAAATVLCRRDGSRLFA